MKRFRYAQRNLLQLREMLRDQRRGEMAEAQSKLDQQLQAREQVRARMTQAHEAVSAKGKQVSVGYLNQRERHLAELRRLEGYLDGLVEAAREDLAICLTAYQQAARELRQLELNRDRQAENWEREFRAFEQKELDEVGTTRAGRLAMSAE